MDELPPKPLKIPSQPDFLDAYPPLDIDPFKHKKIDRPKNPPPNLPGNLGPTDKDWEIPKLFADNGDFRSRLRLDL